MRIAVLHPGAMGASVAAALNVAGHEVFWLSEGRSEETRTRAQDYVSVDSLVELVNRVEAIVSVCPPHAALEQAQVVADSAFRGCYVDANAVAPQAAQQIAGLFGDRYVDGGIIGPPAWQKGSTRLYLSGGQADRVASWFAGSLMGTAVIDDSPSSASALKMCYAGYTKGASAMLLAVRALAEQLGVAGMLEEEWRLSQPGLEKRVQGAAKGVAPKAWRFEGEMREIAATFAAAGLPSGFHDAAGDLYRRLAPLKNQQDVDLQTVMSLLTRV